MTHPLRGASMSQRARELRALARARLLDPSPEAVQRLECALGDALDAADWESAKRLLAFRRELSSRVRDSQEDVANPEGIAEDIEYVQARGVGPGWKQKLKGQ